MTSIQMSVVSCEVGGGKGGEDDGGGGGGGGGGEGERPEMRL